MYVCICNAITEKDIHMAVKEGISSLEQLSESTSVSRVCGCCENNADRVLQEAMLNREDIGDN